ncbi:MULTISPECIES: ester cyclase [Microbacterium]|uniref:ester cyclase n=1 Tax=Microbacterium TaxID=33882 RepID=UPI0023DB1337|nr:MULTISPECIES: ester cyclase [Microbacterium]MDF2048099.1 ester cyclase [Microbacterium sp. Kw_RZR3]MDF2919311.1 putative ester cyclase [Microbacterium sp.]MDQ1075203.1 putative ester cyclase [Microbacterium sp. SORGH_AS_0969]MDQ1115434.1 putative ester cyclase [Microbacterium testaceum]
MEAGETRDWFADFLDAQNRRDLEAVRGFLDPGMRRAHLPAGAEAWIADYAELLHAFPDWQWRRIQLIVEDDRLAVHVRGSGTHTGTYRHLSATRRRVNIAAFAIYRLSHGRIVEASGTDDAEQIRALLV